MHLYLCKSNHYSLNCTWKKVISKIHCKDKNKISIAFFVHSLTVSSCRQNYRPHAMFRNWRRWNSCILELILIISAQFTNQGEDKKAADSVGLQFTSCFRMPDFHIQIAATFSTLKKFFLRNNDSGMHHMVGYCTI